MIVHSCHLILHAGQEYENADVQKKKIMLEKMLTLGVRNCSWVHSLTMNTTNKDSESEKTVKNFFTRPLLL